MTKEQIRNFEKGLNELIEMNAECRRMVERSNNKIQEILFQLSEEKETLLQESESQVGTVC